MNKILLIAIALISVVGTAVAMPAEIDIEDGLVIIPDGIDVKSYTVLVYDIDYSWALSQTGFEAHTRTITVETTNSNLEARIHGNGADTTWTSNSKKSSTYTASPYNTYTFTLELKGTQSGALSIYDNMGNVYDMSTGMDANVASDSVAVPEFPTIALPVAAILGLAFIFQRRREED